MVKNIKNIKFINTEDFKNWCYYSEINPVNGQLKQLAVLSDVSRKICWEGKQYCYGLADGIKDN